MAPTGHSGLNKMIENLIAENKVGLKDLVHFP